jgi:2-methylcitrate dehydratase
MVRQTESIETWMGARVSDCANLFVYLAGFADKAASQPLSSAPRTDSKRHWTTAGLYRACNTVRNLTYVFQYVDARNQDARISTYSSHACGWFPAVKTYIFRRYWDRDETCTSIQSHPFIRIQRPNVSCTNMEYDKVVVDIVEYVYDVPITSSLAFERARLALLDSLGCAIETLAHSSEARSFIGPVVPGTLVPNGFRLPGSLFELDPVKGAFDLGSLIRYLDHNDAYPGAEWGHPSDNLGAILAVAGWCSRSHAPIALKDVLVAQIKAYEIQGLFQIKNSFNSHGLDHTILVKIASTAVVAHLMQLSKTQALSALSHAWQDGHPLRTFRHAPNAGPRKGWAAGDACSRAVHICLLARAGQPGAPNVLTTPRWGFYDALFGGKVFELPRPYGSFVIEYHFFKLIAAEAHAISAAQAAVQLVEIMKTDNVNIDEIDRVTIRTQLAAKTIIDKVGPLHNRADRDHCLQYIIAVTLIKGSYVESTDYDDDSPWATDYRVENLRAKMIVVEDEKFTQDYLNPKVRSGANAIKIHLGDGRDPLEAEVHFPIGHPKHPETLDLVLHKFWINMKKGLFSVATIQCVLDCVNRDDATIDELLNLMAVDVPLQMAD